MGRFLREKFLADKMFTKRSLELEEVASEVALCAAPSVVLLAPSAMTTQEHTDTSMQHIPQQGVSSRTSAASSMSPMETLPCSSCTLDGLVVTPSETIPMGSVGSAIGHAPNLALPSLLGCSQAQTEAPSLELEAVKSIRSADP